MRSRAAVSKLVLASTILVFTMGHGDGCCGSEPVLGPPTEALCPPTSSLTYTNFGQPFMEAYCTRCHSSQLSGSARMGAPEFHDFDTQFGVQAVADHIDQAAASGPASTNESMPPSGVRPSLAERQQLAEWIACGAL